MNELIPISEHNGKKAVSARLLHAFLESKQDFSNWIQNRISKKNN
jgi:phage anti-repressor protein